MHELALAQGIVDVVAEQAARGALARARVIHVEVGALSAVMPDALETGFAAVSAGTAAEGARLVFHHVAGNARCRDCGHASAVESRLELCTHCGGARLDVTGGDRMRVVELEVD